MLANFANLESIIAIAVPAEGDSVQPTSGRVSPTALGCFPLSQLCLTERVAGGRCSFMSFRNCVLEASDHPLLDVRTTASLCLGFGPMLLRRRLQIVGDPNANYSTPATFAQISVDGYYMNADSGPVRR